jgi:hypothetical protein
MNVLDQPWQVNREWRLTLPVYRLNEQPFQALDVPRQRIIVNADGFLHQSQQISKVLIDSRKQSLLAVKVAIAERLHQQA